MYLNFCSDGEMANAVDSKSTGSDILRVQVPFWAPLINLTLQKCVGFFYYFKYDKQKNENEYL